MVKISVS